jgi:hypothetical protein
MSRNVVRLVGAAITPLSEDALVRLKVVACLGHEFDASAIDGWSIPGILRPKRA